MKLTKEQEDILNGKEGEFKQGLMRGCWWIGVPL